MEPLKWSDIKAALDQAVAGSHKLELTFKEDAFSDIYFLLGMRGKIIQMPDVDYMNLWAVANSKKWEKVPRNVTITLPPDFHKDAMDWFLGRMTESVLEAILVV